MTLPEYGEHEFTLTVMKNDGSDEPWEPEASASVTVQTGNEPGCVHSMELLEGQSFPPSVVRFLFQLTCDDEPVSGKTESDFTVFEDGDEISIFESSQQILTNTAGYEMASALVLDMSGSIVYSGSLDSLQYKFLRRGTDGPKTWPSTLMVEKTSRTGGLHQRHGVLLSGIESLLLRSSGQLHQSKWCGGAGLRYGYWAEEYGPDFRGSMVVFRVRPGRKVSDSVAAPSTEHRTCLCRRKVDADH